MTQEQLGPMMGVSGQAAYDDCASCRKSIRYVERQYSAARRSGIDEQKVALAAAFLLR